MLLARVAACSETARLCRCLQRRWQPAEFRAASSPSATPPLPQLGIKLQQYLQRVAQQSASSASGGDDSADVPQQVQRLQAALAELDKLGAEGAQSVEQAQMAAIDRKLKACRSRLQQGGGGAAAAKAKAKADKQARKAAKLAEQRRAAETSVGILPAAPSEAVAVPAAGGEGQPPAKRARTTE